MFGAQLSLPVSANCINTVYNTVQYTVHYTVHYTNTIHCTIQTLYTKQRLHRHSHVRPAIASSGSFCEVHCIDYHLLPPLSPLDDQHPHDDRDDDGIEDGDGD